jgi:hypothetical protein
MRISVFAHNSNPEVDHPFIRKSRSYVLELLAQRKARVLDGKSALETIAVQLFAPVSAMDPKTEIEEALGWTPQFGRLRATVLNEGRAGQFPIGYPIPYAFEGHIKMPRAAEVNAVPELT